MDPNVEAVERYATYDIYLDGKPVKLRVVDGAVLEHHSRFHFLKGGKGAWDALKAGGVFISESLGYRFGMDVGQSVQLTTPEGKSSFPIVSVIRDYSSDQGTLHIDRAVYERIWKDHRVQSAALFLKPGASADAVRRSIVAQFPGLDRTIASNTRMKEDILIIFDKTFATHCDVEGGFPAGGVARGGHGSDGNSFGKGKRNDCPGVSGPYPDRNGQDERFPSDDNGPGRILHFGRLRTDPHLYPHLRH